jgi:hypothetical protein
MTPEQIIAKAFSEEFCDTLDGDEFAKDVITALAEGGFVIVPANSQPSNG